MEDSGKGQRETDTGTRVLLVDDDPVILELLSTGLTGAGYRVNTCAQAGEAVESYSENTPDVAVLDVGLPDMPGTDLARKLLQTEYRPILILSNYNDLDIVQRAITSGVVGYLVKPLSVEQLIPSLETSLSHYRQRQKRIAWQLGGEAVSAEHLAEVMDRFPFAVFIVDEQHHPVYRSAAARELLSSGILRIDSAGRLRSRDNCDDFVPVLDHALGKRELPHWRAVLLDPGPEHRLHAWGAPLGNDLKGDAERLATVAVFDARHGNDYTWEALNTLYGLTRKESMLVNGLLRGLSLEDYCAASFVTHNTARTHLKSVFRKTGVNRQSELVRLFCSMFMPE